MDIEDEDDRCVSCDKPAVLLVNFPFKSCYPDLWEWNEEDKSHKVQIFGSEKKIAGFNIPYSTGSVGVRATKPLSRGNRHYWEVYIPSAYGSHMMVGISTKEANLHLNEWVNLLGQDDQSWAMSHKGLLWHNGKSRRYTDECEVLEPVLIGVLFDGYKGTLTYYKDTECLGVAFTGLDKVEKELFPTISSTGGDSRINLALAVREYTGLQDRCRAAILSKIGNNKKAINSLPLPNKIKEYIEEGYFEKEPENRIKMQAPVELCFLLEKM